MDSLWVDTHCHLQLRSQSADELLDRATDVAWIVVPGIDLESTVADEQLVSRHHYRLLFAAGLHPHDAAKWPDQRDDLAGFFDRAVAIGEIGLDFYRNLSPRD